MIPARIATLLIAFWAFVGLIDQTKTAHHPPAQHRHE